MASQLIGRTPCPECGFNSAHVKRSEKTLYRHCPECGAQYMATGEARAATLMAKTRLPDAVAAPTPSAGPTATHSAPETPVSGAPTPTAAIEAPPKPARRGLFPR